MDTSLVIAAAALAATILLLFLFLRARGVNTSLEREQARIREKYGPILNLDQELERRTNEVTARMSARDKLVADYARDHELYVRLKSEVALLEENIDDMSFGVYKPHYGFDTSDKYRAALDGIWQKKKQMVHDGRAAICDTKWTVSGSEREGARMTKQNIKVMLRAFNGETDAAVAKVGWNNVTKMEERIRRAFSAINEMGSANKTRITTEYCDLALAELRLSYEFEKKQHDELEEQREIRERMKEEERAQREFERAQQEAATEQTRYEKALAKARAEVEKANGEEIEAANAKVRELEQKLSEAQAKMQRAKSMAEQTRCGYIYVISNVGSFGERVFKIGMTRRLEPMDRVHELSDASVPFHFDVHAMIYSDDAPTLERDFHRQFENKSVNLVNMRKEFFDLTFDDIVVFAKTRGVTVEFTKLAEAREYRETLALREKATLAGRVLQQPTAPSAFPSTLPSGLPAHFAARPLAGS
jgi:hypothetical protein